MVDIFEKNACAPLFTVNNPIWYSPKKPWRSVMAPPSPHCLTSGLFLNTIHYVNTIYRLLTLLAVRSSHILTYGIKELGLTQWKTKQSTTARRAIIDRGPHYSTSLLKWIPTSKRTFRSLSSKMYPSPECKQKPNRPLWSQILSACPINSRS